MFEVNTEHYRDGEYILPATDRLLEKSNYCYFKLSEAILLLYKLMS